jgi:hypothetical protein
MTRKKANKRVAAKRVGKRAGKRRVNIKKPKDPAVVRQQLAEIVKAEAVDITEAVLNEAIQGELGPAKYLLEMAGVFPPSTDGSLVTKDEESLAETLLRRLDLPTTPIVLDEEDDVVIKPLAKSSGEDEEPEAVKSEVESGELVTV